jgi:glycerophosphoryl diester phosphodiesterase
MLIIGHRGAAGIAAENTIATMHAGIEAGADMLELDIRLTADGVPVIIHDITTRRTHLETVTVGRVTLSELQAKTKDQPIPTLEEVLDKFFGKIKLNFELKSKGSGIATAQMIANYVKQPEDWDHVLLSSFHTGELVSVREYNKHTKLAMLHRHNPFSFVPHQKKLGLSAVGFHQLIVNPVALKIAKKRGLFTYAYTINRPTAARLLERTGLDAIVTNHPDRFKKKS